MKRKPVLKIGAVGDLHCSAIPLVKESRIEQIKKALTYLKEQKVGETFQFLRNGYFTIDKDTTKDKLVINKTVSLKDSWGK